jgi:ribosomal protein S18 acetylase RimI-like enzyme
MDLPVEIDGVRFAVSDPAEFPEIAALIGAAFARADPLSVAAGLSAAQIEGFVRAVTRVENVADLSIVGRDVATGAVVGVLLGEDAAAPPPPAPPAMPGSFIPLLTLFVALVGEMPARNAEPGEVVHLYMLAVDEPATRRGIAQRLVEASVTNAAARGYRLAVTEAAGRVSHHVFGKRGFTDRARVSYAEFEYAGRRPFAAVAAEGAIVSMELDLADRG